MSHWQTTRRWEQQRPIIPVDFNETAGPADKVINPSTYLSCRNNFTPFNTAPSIIQNNNEGIRRSYTFINNGFKNDTSFVTPSVHTTQISTIENTSHTGAVRRTSMIPQEDLVKSGHYSAMAPLGAINHVAQPLIQETHILHNILNELAFKEVVEPWSMNDANDSDAKVPMLGTLQNMMNGNVETLGPKTQFTQKTNDDISGRNSSTGVVNCPPGFGNCEREIQNPHLFVAQREMQNPYLNCSMSVDAMQLPLLEPNLKTDLSGYLSDEKYYLHKIYDLYQQYRVWEKTQDRCVLVRQHEEEQPAGALQNEAAPLPDEPQVVPPKYELPCALPKQLGVWSLTEKIGHGSFSYIYRAVGENDYEIAIKSYLIIKKNREHYPKAVNEVVFLKFLRHPNIMNYICADLKKEYIYLGMEYSPYGSLRNFIIPKARMPEAIVKNIMIQMSSALCYLNCMNILHGNIKPENIIVMNSETMRVKLSDFVSAKVIMRGMIFNKRMGSFLYAAPEVHLSYPSDCRSDLYSLGIVMHEMLFGTLPFEPDITKKQLINDYKQRKPVIITKFNLLSANCYSLLRTLLNFDRHRRSAGRNLLSHPFLNAPFIGDDQCHFQMAYECFLKGVDLAVERNYGHAYIEVSEAILHLQIYIDAVNELGQEENILLKINKYKRYAQLLQERIVCDYITDEIPVSVITEKLRCLLLDSPELLEGFDLCTQGEMCFRLNDPSAVELLKDGLKVIFDKLFCESQGYRRRLIIEKVKDWVKILNLI